MINTCGEGSSRVRARRSTLTVLTLAGLLALLCLQGCSSFNYYETTKYATGTVTGDRTHSDWGLNLFMFGVRYGKDRFAHWGPIFPWLPGFPLLSFEWEKDKGFKPEDDSSWNVRFPGPGLPIILGAMHNMGAAPAKDGKPAHPGESGFTTPIISAYDGNVETLIVGPPILYLFRRDKVLTKEVDYQSYRLAAGVLEFETNKDDVFFRVFGIKPRFLYFLFGQDDFVVPFFWWFFDRDPKDPGFKDYPTYCAYRQEDLSYFIRCLLVPLTLGAFPSPDQSNALKGPWHFPGTKKIDFLYTEDFLKPAVDFRLCGPGFFNKVRDGIWYTVYMFGDGILRGLTGGNAKMKAETDMSFPDLGNPDNPLDPDFKANYERDKPAAAEKEKK